MSRRIPIFKTPESADTQFSIKRPAFKAGTVFEQKKKLDPLTKSVRSGLGNRDITRINFLAAPIKPRSVPEIKELGASEIVTDTDLGYITKIKVPDPTDFEWIREKKRLDQKYTDAFRDAGFPADEIPAMVARELEINKPLGRDQRKVVRKTSDIVTDNRLNVNQKLAEIAEEVKQGRLEGTVDRTKIAANILLILGGAARVEFSKNGILQLKALLKSTGMPKDRKNLGIRPRFVDINYYNDKRGLVNLLIFNNLRDVRESKDYDYTHPVKDFSTSRESGLPAITLEEAKRQMRLRSRNRKFLDLDRVGLVSVEQIEEFAAKDPLGGFKGRNFEIDMSLITRT